jgi:hypothetical protein
MTKKTNQPPSGEGRAWDRYQPQLRECPICGRLFTRNAATCRSPECAREYNRRYARKFYEANSARIIAQQSAAKKRQYKPIIKQCIAPHPTKQDAICGKEFEVVGRQVTCSPECSQRRRNALQTSRYHANPQAKRDHKNAHYAANYAMMPAETRCPNPGCRRLYTKYRSNQNTCPRPSCHAWEYQTNNREKVNEKKREKRRGNPEYAAYQKGYREKNPDKFRSYRPKINARQQQRRAAARQKAIANGTFIDGRRKLTESQITKVRKRRGAGETLTKVAKAFGIHFSTVARICKHKRL